MTIPRIPSSAIPSIAPMSSRCAMSFSIATGSTRSSTKVRTVSWISRCSSVSSKSTARSLVPNGALTSDGGVLIRHPHGEQPPVVGDEMLVLVFRERVLNRLHEQVVERLALDELERQLVEVRQVLGAELAVRVDVEVALG